MSDFRDKYPRMQIDKLMGGIRLPHVRPCVVVNESHTGYVQFTHYDKGGFRVKRSGNSWFTSEAWSIAVAYATTRGLPVFRSGQHQTEKERS